MTQEVEQEREDEVASDLRAHAVVPRECVVSENLLREVQSGEGIPQRRAEHRRSEEQEDVARHLEIAGGSRARVEGGSIPAPIPQRRQEEDEVYAPPVA